MSKNLIIGVVAVVLLGGGALYILNKSTTVNPAPVVQNQQPSPTTPVTSPTTVTQTQPKPPTIVTGKQIGRAHV